MAFIEWRDDYLVGVPEIDAQHRRLIEMVNLLHEAMKTGGKQNRLLTVVDELVVCARANFAREEALMKRINYPGLNEHARMHCAMMIRTDAFRHEIAAGNAGMSLKLMRFLKDWLTSHILEADMDYRRHMAARQAA